MGQRKMYIYIPQTLQFQEPVLVHANILRKLCFSHDNEVKKKKKTTICEYSD